jgi:vancomycin resistance protein YoaR
LAVLPARRSSGLVRARGKTRAQRRRLVQRASILAALLALAGIALGLAFAGSPTRLAAGVRIAGIDVGGMRPGEARALLEHRAQALEQVPVTFRAAGQSWHLTPHELGVRVDWHGAIEAARREGRGFGPFRGFRRLDMRVFGADVEPSMQAYEPALQYELGRIAQVVDTRHRDAAIVLRGLHPQIVPARTGNIVDRQAAADVIVRSLASLSRDTVDLPVRVDAPHVTANDLTVTAAQVKTALSAPVHLTLGSTRFRIGPRRIAGLLELPAAGRRDLRIGGPGASRWFAQLGKSVGRPPEDAGWAVTSHGIRVVPARPGIVLDVASSADALLRGVLVTVPQLRSAMLVAQPMQPERTTAEARAMHIVGQVSSYQTFYGGEANRIHNVQLVAHLVDGQVIAPGATFSFNHATGARTAAKGFLEAPVIINGELKTGLGGGVCQVSTTVFNAAYEAGLPITARTNHALYISHYPQGRDATVNYPDVDLQFVNDTGHWLLLRTWVGSSSLTVALYGTPVHRRVVSDVAPLVVTGPPPVKETLDPSLDPGARVIDDSGSPSRTTSVRRRVYSADGKLLHDAVFYSSYRAEPELVRIGPKPQPPKRKVKKQPAKTTPTTTTSTTTTTTTPQP